MAIAGADILFIFKRNYVWVSIGVVSFPRTHDVDIFTKKQKKKRKIRN